MAVAESAMVARALGAHPFPSLAAAPLQAVQIVAVVVAGNYFKQKKSPLPHREEGISKHIVNRLSTRVLY